MGHEQPIPNIPVVEDGDWKQYQLVIIQKLNEHSQAIAKVDAKVDTVQSDLAALKAEVGKLEVKAGFWGTLGGVLAVVLASFKSKVGL